MPDHTYGVELTLTLTFKTDDCPGLENALEWGVGDLLFGLAKDELGGMPDPFDRDDSHDFCGALEGGRQTRLALERITPRQKMRIMTAQGYQQRIKELTDEHLRRGAILATGVQEAHAACTTNQLWVEPPENSALAAGTIVLDSLLTVESIAESTAARLGFAVDDLTGEPINTILWSDPFAPGKDNQAIRQGLFGLIRGELPYVKTPARFKDRWNRPLFVLLELTAARQQVVVDFTPLPQVQWEKLTTETAEQVTS